MAFFSPTKGKIGNLFSTFLQSQSNRWEGTIKDLNYHCLDINENQVVNQESSADTLAAWVKRCQLSDVIVVSHGWNTLPEGAKHNYDKLFGHVSDLLKMDPIPDCNFGVIGIT